jgi:protein-L-isoaspartate(D-aspartate) O-methyltransferase
MSIARAKLFVSTIVLGLAGDLTAAPSMLDWKKIASDMVDREIVAAGVTNERVIQALRETPRHEFVPANQRQFAYFDMALPIGEGQTISPPFIVASMTEALDPQPTDRVLEIGTGSGYQAAVLSPLTREVYTIEIVESLARRATRTLKRLGYKNVQTRTGDGYLGWPEAAPFDKIIVTCSPERVPQPLVEQLREGGLMVIPVGERYQQTLYLMRKVGGKFKAEALRPTLFVPMTGQAETERGAKPDPKNPQIVNGGFEQTFTGADGEQQATGWHYQRQMILVTDQSAAPEGERFVMFRNQNPGRAAHALQGFAIDGRSVSAVELLWHVRARDVQPASGSEESPRIIVVFYNERRATVGQATVGSFVGTHEWREEKGLIRVPLSAREAIIRIGLLGAVGELSFDDIRLRIVE